MKKDPFSEPGVPARIVSLLAYKVTADTSEDGRGPTRFVGWYINKDLAIDASRGISAWGRDGDIEPLICDVAIYNDPKTGLEVKRRVSTESLDIEFVDSDDVRARTLAKLTPIERKALGLK